MRILVLTVGGSSQPVVSSILQNKPDRLAFLCSDDIPGTKGSYIEVEGPGLVCERGTMPNIITQARAMDISRKIVKIKELDDPNACYVESLELLSKLRRKYPEAQIIADYTGATKSMSSGLVLAAMDTQGVILGVQAGLRTDREKVVHGTQFTRLTYSHVPIVNRQSWGIADLMRRFDYPAAILILEDILATPDLVPAIAAPMQIHLALARGLNAWDRFDHATAWDLLQPIRAQHVELVKFLEAVVWSRRRLEPRFEELMSNKTTAKPKGHGYELVQDILLNAERRAAQGRYDDAAARMYRAVEMLAQARLLYKYEVRTANLEMKRLPKELRPTFRRKGMKSNKVIQLGLRDAYDLLAALTEYEEEPLGRVYSGREASLLVFLGIRNQGLHSHGFTPIGEADYLRAGDIAGALCRDGITAILKAKGAPKPYADPIQFPQTIAQVVFKPAHSDLTPDRPPIIL